jgi:hypothetical protein
VAHHEAGHAVAHVLYRLPFEEVHIVPGDEFGGQCIGAHPLAHHAFNPRSFWVRRRLKRHIIISLAGPAAHVRARGYQSSDWIEETGADGDLDTAQYWAGLLYPDPKKALAFVAALNDRAAGLWEHAPYWRAVVAVADALLREPYHYLPAVTVRSLVRTAMAA